MSILTASVVLANTTRAFDKKYTYLIPKSLDATVFIGSRVLVPFGSRSVLKEGYVFDIQNDMSMDNGIELKNIERVMEPYPILKKDNIQLIEWMRHQYICTYYDVIKCMLPPGSSVKTVKTIFLKSLSSDSQFKKSNLNKIIDTLKEANGEYDYNELKEYCQITGFPRYIQELCDLGVISVEECYQQRVNSKFIRAVSLAKEPQEIEELLENNTIKKIQHIRVLEILKDNDFVSVADIQRFADVSSATLNTLSKHGYIKYLNIEVNRNPLKNKQFERTVPLEPTQEQAKALVELNSIVSRQVFSEALLHGITGSGKTEVYLQLISHCFDIGKRAIMLVPEISLTPQMVERFVARFGNRVAIIHSRLSLGERYDQWRLINEGKVDVVVGARSAVFSPVENLGLIIVDEEHEGSYKSESIPRYSARDVARRRCEINNALLIYGSATPSVETYYRAKKGEINLIEMKNRPLSAALPSVELIDMRDELENGNKTPFSRRLLEELTRNIELDEQSILFLNRRGYSTFVMCRSCGHTMKCPECNIALTYHSKEERLICHYCGFTVKNPTTCPACGSNHIRYFGVGTQKIEDEIRQKLPQSSVIRMDVDTTGYKNSHEDILNKFKKQNINIMVGTQMIAKGHDFPNVTLVGILAADSMINSNDFKSAERTFQLLTQAAGRAGRANKPGRVIIQTYNTEEYSILAACTQNYSGFYSQEIILREKLGYPPFMSIGVITFSGLIDRKVFDAAKWITPQIAGSLNAPSYEFSVLGPSRCPIYKIANRYRWRIVVKSNNQEALIKGLTHIYDNVWSKSKEKDILMSIDINPNNML